MTCLILVVDDEPSTRHMLRLLLELDGFQVFEAEDGVDALAKIKAHRPDVMILDVMMPNMDGITVCKTVRNEATTADLPVIMLSGKTQLSAIEEGLQAGANKYLCKPMDHKDLLSNIREVLSISPATAS